MHLPFNILTKEGYDFYRETVDELNVRTKNKSLTSFLSDLYIDLCVHDKKMLEWLDEVHIIDDDSDMHKYRVMADKSIIMKHIIEVNKKCRLYN